MGAAASHEKIQVRPLVGLKDGSRTVLLNPLLAGWGRPFGAALAQSFVVHL
jgi:hypothetical protein